MSPDRKQTHYYKGPGLFRRVIGKVFIIIVLLAFLIGLGFMVNLMLGAA